MKKLLAIMLMFVFSTPIFVISTEKKPIAFFDKIPTNPNLYHDVSSFSTADLTGKVQKIKLGSKFKIRSLITNKAKTPVFKLSNGRFIRASHDNVYEDIVLRRENVKGNYWLKKTFTVYQTPYVAGTKIANTKLTNYNKVHISQKAITKHGIYLKADGQGWINEKDLTVQDNRMEKVQALLTRKYNKPNYSIYVKQLKTRKTAGINEDKSMYSASVTKLPILYFIEKQIKDSKVKLTDKFKYIEQVNQFKGAYKVEGSGEMPKKADNKYYTVDSLLKAVTQHSDNVASNILGYYIAHQYDKTYQKTVLRVADVKWNMESRNVSSKTAANVMEALYSQKCPVISYLTSTEFDNTRISRDISVPVAHKIGDAYDYKHDVAIIYADQPFILSVFTDKSSYEDISAIADDVYGILK
ncbi:MAG: serine hydrolase [Streptococcus mutans]|uniref:serine hydrolase n=1 Tax=Streptococcus mutans TaxID=1309 RepID=UPI00232BFC31|nr:serine hydrolase [Streptococcus mutans]MDB8632058.1 serine hydrolase [Streptococcus mutans]MEE0813807.1 serine hydrolase [Streptococcus mutans]